MPPDWCLAIISELSETRKTVRIGAKPSTTQKLPWVRSRAELIPAKVRCPQRAGQSRPRPDVSFPSFVAFRNGANFPGAKSGGAFGLGISPFSGVGILCPPQV